MLRSLSRFTALVLTTATFAACGNGGSAVAPTLPHSPSTSGRTAKTTFTIKWTNGLAPASVRRRDTISPSAQSFTVSINGTVDAIVNRTASPTQSVSLDAPIGSDLFVFNIYDGIAGLGKLLGTASVAQQIVDGTANTITASIQAVCAATNVASAGDDPLLYVRMGVTGVFAPTAQAIVLAGQSSATFIVAPEDADGNVIIGGPGGTVAHSITGSATVTAIDGSHLSLTPTTGLRSTTPDTLTVSAPACPQTTVAVQHSPAIYAQGAGGAVKAYDWYGDLLLSATINNGETLIGYSAQQKVLITNNSATGAINAYSDSLTGRSLEYSVLPTNLVTWSNNLNSVFGAFNENGLAQYFTDNGFNVIALGAPSTGYPGAIGVSTLSTSPYAYSSPGKSIAQISLTTGGVLGTAQTNVNVFPTSFAIDDASAVFYAFFGSQLIQRYTQTLSSGGFVETSGSFGFSTPITYGAIDTDGDNLIGLSPSGSLYVSSGTTQLAGFNANIGAASALVVLSTNEH